MAQDEQTTAQQVASEEESFENSQQALEDSSQEQPVVAEGEIPEKFVGKSSMELIQAYTELEKDTGRLRTELGTTRKEREAFEEKWRLAERSSMQQASPIQTPPQQAFQPTQEQDPLSAFDTKFDEDPKAAIKEAIQAQRQMAEQQNVAQVMQQRAFDANEWYNTQRKDNSDYARREPQMQRAYQQYGYLIKPEHLNSVHALQILDLVSKGMDIDYYTKQAVTKSQTDGLSVDEEKRRSQSETSNSDGESTKNLNDLSIEELEQLYGEADE